MRGAIKDLPKLVPWYRGINGPIKLQENTSNKGVKKQCWRTSGQYPNVVLIAMFISFIQIKRV